jgi:hypothetical protein
MDFRQTTQPAASRPAPVAPVSTGLDSVSRDEKPVRNKKKLEGKWLRILNSIVLFGVAILLAGIAVVATRSSNDNEFKFVDQSKYQAVFLQSGQVYFGNIDALNSKYIDLTNVYYLQTNSTDTSSTSSTSSGYTLMQLGCQQIHDPEDQMLINRDQVTFWENLQDKGTVVTKINEFKKNFPDGPDCSQVTTQTQASDSSTQGATTTPDTSTTGTTKTTTGP